MTTTVSRYALAAGCVAASLAGCAKPAPPAPANPPQIPLATARAGSVVETVVAQGRVGSPAGANAKLAFAVAGIVRTIDVRVGQRVDAGAPLASLDGTVLASAVDAARANLDAANASFAGGGPAAAAARSAQTRLASALTQQRAYENGGRAVRSDQIAARAVATQARAKVAADERTLERQTTLFAGGVIAAKDVDLARTQLALDRADERSALAKISAAQLTYDAARRQTTIDVATARSDAATAATQLGAGSAAASAARVRLLAAEHDAANGTLTAPEAGIVIAVYKHVGEPTDTTTPVVEIAPPVRSEVTLGVPAGDAARVHVGDAASLDFGAGRARSAGRISAVVPEVDPTTQLATIVVAADRLNASAGDAVTVSISVATVRGIVVPTAAIVTDPQTGRTVAFVRNAKDGFDQRTVDIAANDGTTVALRSGLHPNDRVAARGAYELLAPPN